MRAFSVLLFWGAGCALIDRPQLASIEEQRLTAERIQKARRITIDYGGGGLGCAHAKRWVFERNGECFGETVSSMGYQSSSERTCELPPETFQQVQQILLKSQFRKLKPGAHGFHFEGCSWIDVDCDGARHSVTFNDTPCSESSPRAALKACKSLCDYLDELDARTRPPSLWSPDASWRTIE